MKSHLRTIAHALVACASLTAFAADKEMSTDVVVVGGGAAGLSAAVSAAQNGAKVILLERLPFTGGAASYAEGLFGSETEWQRMKAIDLTNEEAYKHSMEFNHYRANAALVRQTIANSSGTLNWLHSLGIDFEPVAISPTEALSWHLVKEFEGAHHGAALTKCLDKRAKELGVKILLETPGKELILNGGRVAGVKAVNAKGDNLKIRAKSVILAAGGMGNNKTMIAKYTRFNPDTVYPAVPLNKQGETWDMAVAAGGEIGGAGCMLYPGAEGKALKPIGPLYTFTWQPQNVWVNKHGARFVAETITSSFALAGNAIEAQRGSIAWAIFTDQIIDHVTGPKGIDNGLGVLVPIGAQLKGLREEFAAELATGSGVVAVADTPEALAKATGMDPATLKATIEDYNKFVAQKRDDAFLKNPSQLWPMSGKLYALKMSPHYFVTIGGAKVNLNWQVVDKDDKAIPGLYATGADADGMFGDTYTLWTSGMMFQTACQSGMMAGTNAAKQAK